jgi:hypothetical protein
VTARIPERVGSAASRRGSAILAAAVAAGTALGGCVSMPSNDYRGDPVTYAARQATPGAADPDAAARVEQDFAGEPQLVGVKTTHTASGLEVVVTLTRNDDGVQDVWLADLAVGAVAERSRSDEAVVSELISSASAVGPDKQGRPMTTSLGIGAVRLGQVFGSPDDCERTLRARRLSWRVSSSSCATLTATHSCSQGWRTGRVPGGFGSRPARTRASEPSTAVCPVVST